MTKKKNPNGGRYYNRPLGDHVPRLHADHIHQMRRMYAQDELVGLSIEFDANGMLHSLTMDIDNAMYLLAILKGFQLDEDIPFPDDPRDPTWTADQYVSKKKPEP